MSRSVEDNDVLLWLSGKTVVKVTICSSLDLLSIVHALFKPGGFRASKNCPVIDFSQVHLFCCLL